MIGIRENSWAANLLQNIFSVMDETHPVNGSYTWHEFPLPVFLAKNGTRCRSLLELHNENFASFIRKQTEKEKSE